MGKMQPSMEPLAHDLLAHGVVEFGSTYILPDGESTQAHIDLQPMMASPQLFKGVVGAYATAMEEAGLVPGTEPVRAFLAPQTQATAYAAGAIACDTDLPLVGFKRYVGDRSRLLGLYDSGDRAILLGETLSSVDSVLSGVRYLSVAGLAASNLVVLVDRQRGARKPLETLGMRVDSVFTLHDLAQYALQNELGGMTPDLYESFKAELDKEELAPQAK